MERQLHEAPEAEAEAQGLSRWLPPSSQFHGQVAIDPLPSFPEFSLLNLTEWQIFVNDEVIHSRETLMFNDYWVGVGELEGGQSSLLFESLNSFFLFLAANGTFDVVLDEDITAHKVFMEMEECKVSRSRLGDSAY
ncbi:uncharacterized protein J3R85_003822 [Psidium guajava]|nr:uncharacterized protein J3R85_003822 [Psidium guajava]